MNKIMKAPLLNPLTLFIGICTLLIAVLLLWLGLEESIVKILFAPYLLDISAGVGDLFAQIFRWVTFGSHLIVIAFVVSRYIVKEKVAKIILSLAGIFFASLHFSIVGLGYFTTLLH